MKSLLKTVLLLLYLITISKQCKNSNCSANCNCCTSPYYCNSCNSYFGGNISIVNVTDPNTTLTTIRIERTCIRCTDPRCVSCSFNPEYCNYCVHYYGRNIYSIYQCQNCTTSVANACSSVNNCSMFNNCAICPQFYLDTYQNICMPCNSTFRNCYTCTPTVCLSCMSSYYLNIASNNRQCVRCTLPNCQYCGDGPICYSCMTGFYLDSNRVCRACSDPCTACNSSSICLACEPAGDIFLLVNDSCKLCSNIFANCLTCIQNGGTGIWTCTSCRDGWYVGNTSCVSCILPCLTCSTSSNCLTCSSLGYYFNSGTCTLCNTNMTNCVSCISNSICLTCVYGYVVALQINTCTACDQLFVNCANCTKTQCLTCKAGFDLASGSCIVYTNCISSCKSCEVGFPVNCVTCYAGKYVPGTTKSCQPCPPPCITCQYNTNTSSAWCLSCSQGKYVNNNGGCHPCSSGTYYLNTVNSCINCSTYCTTCTVTQCSTCESSLFYVSSWTGRCEDVCGDGYVVALPCDVVAGIANDGCAEDCTVQPGYNCTNTSTTNPIIGSTAVVMTSQCSYIGQLTIKVYKAVQSTFSNQLTLLFKVQPYVYGLPTGTEGQAVLRTIFQLTPLDILTDYVISVDPAQETVSFDISYSVDISKVLLNFKVNLVNLASNPMFQSQTNQAATFRMESILATSRLGQNIQEKDRNTNQLIFIISTVISAVGYITLFLGLFSRQLAGLEHMQICQTIYLLVLFRPQSNFSLQGFLGFKHSVSVDVFSSYIGAVSQSPGYIYQINTNSFVNNFNINFLFMLVPAIISPIFMLYRIKNKHLPVKKDFARSVSELLIGQMLLYFVIFNLYGLVIYSYLYMHSSLESQITNTILMVSAGLFSIFAISHLFFRPQVVGCFRSAFSSFKNQEIHEQKESKLSKKLKQCISWRYKADNWNQGYGKISINFYFISLGYQIVAIVLIIYQLTLILACLQFFVLILLFVVKPYFKPRQKFRSLLTYIILIFASLTNVLAVGNSIMPTVLLALVSIHTLLVSYIVINSSYYQLKKKCTERSEIVRRMFKEDKEVAQEDQVQQQIQVVQKLIIQYHKLGIKDKFQPYQKGNIKESAAPEEAQQIKDEAQNNEYLITEERILAQENRHLRYLEGMNFINKYGYQVDYELIKDNYKDI